MTYTLYITNKRYSSWSMRPWVLLKALDIPFDEKLVYAEAKERQTIFYKFCPTGLVPCLYDAEQSHTVWESLALCEYIAEEHPQVWPTDRVARAFARSAAAEMHAGFDAIRNECGMNVGLRIDIGTPSAALQKNLDRFTELFNDGISKFGGPWLAGKEFTAADAFFAPIACRLNTYGLHLDGEAQKYIDRLWEHPAVQLWVKQGRAETQREPFHEKDALAGNRKLLEEY